MPDVRWYPARFLDPVLLGFDAADRLDHLVPVGVTRRVAVQEVGAADARRVGEQVAQRDRVLAGLCELGDGLGDRVVERERTALRLLGDGDRNCRLVIENQVTSDSGVMGTPTLASPAPKSPTVGRGTTRRPGRPGAGRARGRARSRRAHPGSRRRRCPWWGSSWWPPYRPGPTTRPAPRPGRPRVRAVRPVGTGRGRHRFHARDRPGLRRAARRTRARVRVLESVRRRLRGARRGRQPASGCRPRPGGAV